MGITMWLKVMIIAPKVQWAYLKGEIHSVKFGIEKRRETSKKKLP